MNQGPNYSDPKSIYVQAYRDFEVKWKYFDIQAIRG